MQWTAKKIRETSNYLRTNPRGQKIDLFVRSWKNRFRMSPHAYKFDSFVRSWKSTNPINWPGVNVPFEPGLVSVILPSFNGEKMISEAIESLLAQSYQNMEIIAINDGSSDNTGAILDEYAARDSRVKVHHQENQQIPKTLSRGSRLARGEFLTWTSTDNRLKKNCIEMLVGSIERNPSWDMVYANIDIIDADGNPLIGGNQYSNNQVPLGSEHIHLSEKTAELNTWNNNLIGAAFLYRARVAWTIGDYSASRFLVEDYDYWMRVNALMTLRHVDFRDCIYDYRFHDNSLTSKVNELGIPSRRAKLMRFDDFRRNFYLSKSAWIVTDDGSDEGQNLSRSIRIELEGRTSVVLDAESADKLKLPRLWMPVVQVHCAETVQSSSPLPKLHDNVCSVYVSSQQGDVSGTDWDFFITTDSIPASDLPRLEDGYRGWWSVPEVSDLITLCEIQAKNRQLSEIELQALTLEDSMPDVDCQSLSVVICTDRHSTSLENCLESLMAQTLAPEKFEIILVKNDSLDVTPERIAEKISSKFAGRTSPRVTVIDCPLCGVNYARNAGLSECRGDLVVFLDEDAVAKPDCLEHLATAFAMNPGAGVIGGHTRLNVPDPRPEVLQPGQERFWSQYLTDYETCTEVENRCEFPDGALWGASRRALFEMGGFRCNFGRTGSDEVGGEKVVAAVLARTLGYSVWIEPKAEVLFDVEEHRYTRQHVEKTIRSSLMVDYQLQSELYLPAKSTLALVVRDYLASVTTRIALMVKGFIRNDTTANVEAFYAHSYARGRALVIRQSLLDAFRRFFKPVVDK